MHESLSKRYCSGCIGVPITVLDKYNPEQLEIVKFRKGNDEKDLTYTTGVTRLSKQASKQASSGRLRLTSEFWSARYCNGIIGVPITFLDKWSKKQFKIIGLQSSAGYNKEIVGIPLLIKGDARPRIGRKTTYARIFISKIL